MGVMDQAIEDGIGDGKVLGIVSLLKMLNFECESLNSTETVTICLLTFNSYKNIRRS